MNQKTLYSQLRQTKEALIKFNEGLPDKDAYCMPYSYICQLIEKIDVALRELPQSLSDARKDDTGDTENRAKEYCQYGK